MEIYFVNKKNMKRKSWISKISLKLSVIREEYKNNKKIFFLNLLKFRLPKKCVIGLFTPPNKIKIDVESIYKHFSNSEKTCVNQIIKTINHEILHYAIYKIDKYRLDQEHWAIRKMGY